jgi:hypothetical protein
MTLTAEHESIKAAFEAGVSLEAIAEDRKLDMTVVKSALMQSSSLYRKQVAGKIATSDTDEDLDFTDEELKMVNSNLLRLALNAEDEGVQARVGMYIRDDKKGRREVQKVVQQNTFNLLDFNRMIQERDSRAQAIKATIDLQPA